MNLFNLSPQKTYKRRPPAFFGCPLARAGGKWGNKRKGPEEEVAGEVLAGAQQVSGKW